VTVVWQNISVAPAGLLRTTERRSVPATPGEALPKGNLNQFRNIHHRHLLTAEASDEEMPNFDE
jgi:hypothetical protein